MRREQQIHKAGLNCFQTLSFLIAFMRGANWADRHPRSPWISVRDKLPVRYEPVIISFETHNVDGTIGHYSCTAILNISGEWIAFAYNVQNTKINAKVTHWMPIPELQEKGGKE